jgi:cytochrome c
MAGRRRSTGAWAFRYPDRSRRDVAAPVGFAVKPLLNATFVIACMVCLPAAASPELANKKNCMACHRVDQKVIGPSYKDVALKYAGQNDAVAKLSQKVIKGGAGVWGPVPMPANPQVNEAEARQLVQWILSVK